MDNLEMPTGIFLKIHILNLQDFLMTKLLLVYFWHLVDTLKQIKSEGKVYTISLFGNFVSFRLQTVASIQYSH